ncbi:MAG TPA: hypothetical protein DCZ94_00150 [Lentisphaeria bacterium]|nr:MAG: hypothetical protein A2X48_15575 [Lentisphaerae bacterium GWF2_49_21]HBC85344.1 hypothetical protein [Lentisphaeria bacterium]
MESIANIASLTLAIFLSISQWFSDGIAEYQKKNYDKAVTAFTKVIDEKVKPNPLYGPSLYWRSKCFVQLKKNDESIADIKLLLETAPEGELSVLAAADFKELTGKEWDLVNRDTPEAAWESLRNAFKKRDKNALMKCVCEKMGAEAEIEIADEHRSEKFWAEGAKIDSAKVSGVKYNKEKTKALLVFAEGTAPQPSLMMEKAGGKWVFAGKKSRSELKEFEMSATLEKPSVKVAISDDERKEIESLIAELGAADPGKRKTAYEKLKALGDKASELLEKAKGNPDPEIAIQAKKLLSGK